MNNILIIISFILCLVAVMFGVAGFILAFRPNVLAKTKNKVDELRRIGRIILAIFIIIFIIGTIFEVYIIRQGFQ